MIKMVTGKLFDSRDSGGSVKGEAEGDRPLYQIP